MRPAYLLVAAGILAGHFSLLRRAKRKGLDPFVAAGMSLTAVLSAFALGHVIALFYEVDGFRLAAARPLRLLNFFSGLSSLGAMLGGVLGAAGYLACRRLKARDSLKYLDAAMFVFPFAWILPRLGCSLVHDHPGIRATGWLAVRFPGGARYDLGLLELLFTLAVAGAFLLLDRRPRPAGFFLATFLLLFGPFRILLNELRVEALGYGPLTVDQWGGLVMLSAGMIFLLHARKAGV